MAQSKHSCPRTLRTSRISRARGPQEGTNAVHRRKRAAIRNGQVPGEQIGKLWYVDWTAFSRSDGNDLVAMVLKGAA
ncbi:hypothetical protein [Pseudomonas sp. MF6776]|uniref:hypothetical protein n=1 Tax=Pseudomonas sp. MF6776 TaxID=2797534 RepID=UPI003FA343C9